MSLTTCHPTVGALLRRDMHVGEAWQLLLKTVCVLW